MGANRQVVGLLALIFVAGCGGAKGPNSGSASSTAGASTTPTTPTSQLPTRLHPPGTTPQASPSPTSTNPAPTTSPSPSTSTSPSPAPAPSSTGSGGTSTQTGTFSRSVATAAQTGLPSINVGYKLFVPSGYVFNASQPVPLVVSELTTLNDWEPIAQAEGFIVAEQQGYLGNGGYVFTYDPLVLQGILQDVENTWNVDTSAVYLTGFSAGAHFTYEIGLQNGDLFAGLGICSGDLRIAIQDGVWIQDSKIQPNVPRAVPVSIRQGTQDTVVPLAAGQFAEAQLLLAQFPVDYAEFNGGHTVDTNELQGIWDYLKTKRLP